MRVFASASAFSLSRPLVVCTALLLGACGGGGDSPAPAPVQPTVAITTANQDVVAAAAANALVGAGTFSAVTPVATADRAVAAGKAVAGAEFEVRAGSLGEALQRLTVDAVFAPIRSDTSVKFAGVVRPLATLTDSRACGGLGDGSISIVLNDADNSQTATPGDSATVTFNACRPEPGVLINGSITVVYVSLMVNQTRTEVGATVSYSNVAASSPEGSFTLNGSVSLSAARQGTLETAQIVIGAGGLTTAVVSVSPQYTDTLTLGGGLTLTATADSAAVPPGGSVPGLATVRLDGAITSTRLPGTVVIATVTPFEQYDVDPFPRAGQVVATGTAGSKLRLTAVDSTTVRIEVDADGNGTYESSVERPWGTLI